MKEPSKAWSSESLSRFLNGESQALVDDTIRLAMQKGFADQTSSLRGAWGEATELINQCLVDYLLGSGRQGGPDGHHSYHNDPRFDRLRAVAQRHHDAGVPLELNHGLFKLYHRTYFQHFKKLLDVNNAPADVKALFPPVAAETFLARLDTFFDEAEVAMLSPWSNSGPREAALTDSLRRLSRERDQYLVAVECLQDPVLLADENGRLFNANQAAMQVFLDISEAGALTYRLAVQPHRIELQAIVDEVLDSIGDQSTTIWMQTPHGKRCFAIRLRVVEDTVYKLDRWRIILMHDITENVRSVRTAQEAEQTMSLFLAAMSHEIRGPLHGILGAANMIKGANSEEAKTLIELIDVSANALNATLENVLSFSRFKHQAPQPRPQNLKLREALNDLIRVKATLALHQDVPLQIEVAQDVPANVRLDWSMTQQILGNLIQNALRHDDGRGVSVGLDAKDGTLIFTVKDHGTGLPDNIRTMLSGPPMELRPRTTETNGTGLGLAIAQRMTLALDGEIAAVDCNEGTQIEVRLPLFVVEATEPRPPSLPRRTDGTGLRCLLLDDDLISATVTVAMIKRLGLSVDHARSIREAEALRDAAPNAYDVFVLDYRVPDGTGTDYAKKLRRDPALREATFFLLSANVDWVRESSADTALFSALLEKPLDLSVLAHHLPGVVQHTPAEGKMLAGLTLSAQRRMAEVFEENWAEFRVRIANTDDAVSDTNIADQAHKLASGAAIFGMKDIADTLREIERSHMKEDMTKSSRSTAHKAFLSCGLPADWFHSIGTSEL